MYGRFVSLDELRAVRQFVILFYDGSWKPTYKACLCAESPDDFRPKCCVHTLLLFEGALFLGHILHFTNNPS